MYKLLLLIAFLGFQTVADAQVSIRVSPADAHKTGTISEPDIKLDMTILNTGTETADILWTRDVIEAPAEWLTYICDAFNCYEPTDSICPETANNIIEPGESINFQIHVLPAGVEGMAMIDVDLFDRNDRDNILATINSTFDVGETTSTLDPYESADLRIYPNPTTNYFRIYQDDHVSTVDVYNMVGKRVKTFTATPDGQYDVSLLPEGMYVVRLLAKDNAVLKTLRLSKQ